MLTDRSVSPPKKPTARSITLLAPIRMTGKLKTILVLAAYFGISEALMIRGAMIENDGWGVAISMGAVVALFCVLAYRKKTWARHLILVFTGFGTFNLFSATLGSPSLLLYALLAAYAFLFWALCWHRPILDFLGVPQQKKS